jgi:hypothetical protein
LNSNTVVRLGYDGRAREALQKVAAALAVPWVRPWPVAAAEAAATMTTTMAPGSVRQQQPLSNAHLFWTTVCDSEVALAGVLLQVSAMEETSRQRASNWRVAKVATATVGGGALLFVTGGLAAPALAAAFTAAGVTSVAVTTLVRFQTFDFSLNTEIRADAYRQCSLLFFKCQRYDT